MNENEIRQVILDKVAANDFHRFIGLEIMELTPSHSKARIKSTAALANPYGSMHGGVLMSVADTVAGATACMNGRYASTVSASLNFLAPAENTEYVYCECTTIRAGKHMIVLDVKITDDRNELLDSGEFSYFAGKEPVVPE